MDASLGGKVGLRRDWASDGLLWLKGKGAKWPNECGTLSIFFINFILISELEF
jgi:hypothetical protein